MIIVMSSLTHTRPQICTRTRQYNVAATIHSHTRQGKARQGKARQGSVDSQPAYTLEDVKKTEMLYREREPGQRQMRPRLFPSP